MAFVKETFITKAAYVKRGRKHRLVKPFAALLAVVLIIGMTGCKSISDSIFDKFYNGWLSCLGKEYSEDWDTWDKEKSIPIAQSYLEDKYGEEFTFVNIRVPPSPYADGLVVICEFIRKGDDKTEDPVVGCVVDVVYEAGEYTVVGDSYMFVHIRKVAEDFLRPYVEKHFSDMEFVFFIQRASTTCGSLDGEYLAEAKIPQNFDELYDVTNRIYFQIIVPISEDQDKVSEACSLLKADLEKLNCEIEIHGCIDVYRSSYFAEISQSPDPRRDAKGFYSREEIM